jgi:HNH endonuclease
MLREAKNAGWVRHRVLPWPRYVFVAGALEAARALSWRRLALGATLQETEAVCVLDAPPRRWWWCRDRFWWEDEGLDAQDVLALVHERDRRRDRRLARAHAVLAQDDEEPRARREPIPVAVREEVFRRDGGRCVACGSDFDLQYDHVIPVALGGSSSAANLQVLCAPCNRRKGAALG